MSRRSLLFALPAALMIAGCVTNATERSLVGAWGGRHVGLELGAAGGTLDYDCAAGAIKGPLIFSADGRFSATGTHSPGHGGPDRVGEVNRAFPAQYSGQVKGDEMVLTVEVAALGARIGPYTLRRGAQPGLTRCL